MFYIWLIIAVILYFFLRNHPKTSSSPLAHALLWPLFAVLLALNYITALMAAASVISAHKKEEQLRRNCINLGVKEEEYLDITLNNGMDFVESIAENLENFDPSTKGLNLDENIRLARAIYLINESKKARYLKNKYFWRQALWDWNDVHDVTIFPRDEDELNNLEHLSFASISYFDKEKITEIPPEVGKLVNLKSIQFGSVSCPEIYITRLKELPDEICNLHKLETIHLQFNGLAFLPKDIGNLSNLKDLKLGGNELMSLPDSITNLKQLEILTVWNNELYDLPSDIGRLTQLKGLDISSNILSELPSSIVKLINLEAFYYDAEDLLLSDEQEVWLQYLADCGCEIYS